jgi:hypothetical protein
MRFLWSDAWLLRALAAAGDNLSLTRLIALGDAINKAIFAREEINGGLGRLARGGYVSIGPSMTWQLTDTGRGIALTSSDPPGLASAAFVERALSAVPWSANERPEQALAGEAEYVPADLYDEAVKTYVKKPWKVLS